MNAAPTATAEATLTDAQLRSLDVPGPRYTSYPTADRFVEAFGPTEYRQALRQRAQGAVVGGAPPLSLYVHIPFCDSLCYYRACNKMITKHHDRAAGYLELLAREIELHVQELGRGQGLSHCTWVAARPPSFPTRNSRSSWAWCAGPSASCRSAEVSIEVDPRTATRQRLRHLADRLQPRQLRRAGLRRRCASRGAPRAVLRQRAGTGARGACAEVRVDQRRPHLRPAQADARVLQPHHRPGLHAAPHRIALYAYAHLPQRFKPQRRIAPADLPSGEQRVQMLGNALAGFVASGYVYIGMDHFALPDDALAVAKRQGRLHRNFQGYTTQPDCDLIGLGVSAIGRVGATYSQNAKTLSEYEDALAQNELPVVRGLALTRDDLLRRSVIMGLMCQGRVEYESVELAHLINFRETFAPELERLKPLKRWVWWRLAPRPSRSRPQAVFRARGGHALSRGLGLWRPGFRGVRRLRRAAGSQQADHPHHDQ